MGQPVITGNQMVQWLRNEFADTYKNQISNVHARLRDVMELGIPSDKLVEFYGYYLHAPHMKIWRRGENITSEPFGSATFSVQNYNWGDRVEWHENDRRYEQTRTLVDRARDLGRAAAILHERVFFEFLIGTVDNDLVPAVPNAPDGAAFFAATAGGTDRFQVTGGNITTGSGVASAYAVRTDIWTAITRFMRMLDGKGQPYWSPDVIDQGILVIHGAQNEQVFSEAVDQSLTAGSTGATNAVSNIWKDRRVSVERWATSRITDNDSFVFLRGAPKKPVFQQEAMSLREQWATMENSDRVRDSKQEYYQVDADYGYGLALPIGAVKINN